MLLDWFTLVEGFCDNIFNDNILNFRVIMKCFSFVFKDFWDLLHPFTHNDVLHQLAHLSHITSHVGKCRVRKIVGNL